jgi:penicillin-binding protein 1A
VYDFGNYSVVSSAAQTYFSKEPKNLAIESAILVGMFKNSGLYNPTKPVG